MSDKRYFTLAEANGMIPDLEAAFSGLLQIRFHMRTVYSRLESSGWAPRGESFDLAPDGAPPEAVSQRASLKVLMSTFRDGLEALESRGCLVKGVEPGLVDWWARSAGREVLLCWRIGEKEVRWWHDPDAGFAGRRPIADLVGKRGRDR